MPNHERLADTLTLASATIIIIISRPWLTSRHRGRKKSTFESRFLLDFADCGDFTGLADISTSFGEEPEVLFLVVEDADLAGGEFEEDGAGAFDEVFAGVLGCWEGGCCHL